MVYADVADPPSTSATHDARLWAQDTTTLRWVPLKKSDLVPPGGGSAVSLSDGADVAEGAKADAAATDSTSSWSVIALLKGIWALLSGGITATAPSSSTSTLTNVPESASNATILAANASRVGFELYNDSDSGASVKCGTTATATSFTKYMMPRERWGSNDLGFNYKGRIDAIWDTAPGTAGHAAMRATEF